MRSLTACALLVASLVSANDNYPAARFTDPNRMQKLRSALPQVDGVFQRFAADKKIPGMVWGVVIDGKLAHLGSHGVRDRSSGAKVDENTVFRIASMTKSFTALAILKLRDDGKLSLEDPVSKWIPEFASMELPTRDTAPIRIRHLLSHSAGFPEDNPWGDQQLAATDAELTGWLQLGIPFSTPPGTRYEYSNYGFGLLGRIVAQASGVSYDQYLQSEILEKLGMRQSTLEYSVVPPAVRATGYRLNPGGGYAEEKPLSHGAFGAMGGLLTNASDLGKYVAYHLSAWPARDDAEAGPVRRSSVREMHQLWRPSNLAARRTGDGVQVRSIGYGLGLGITSNCRFEQMVGHGGGLPGFGSYMLWLPDYGVGLFAMTNLTYAGPAGAIQQSLDVLLKTGGLQKRELPASPILTQTRDRILNLWTSWDDDEANQIAAVNLFLDRPIPERREEIRKLKQELGVCKSPGSLMPENWLRGQFNIPCENGTVGVFFTMAPTQPPRVQHLAFRKLSAPRDQMTAATASPAGVTCSE